MSADPITGGSSVDLTVFKPYSVLATAEVAETLASTDNDDLKTFRRAWIAEALDVLAATSDVRAVVYFDIDMAVNSRHPNWRLTAEPPAIGKWAAKLREPKLRGTIT